MPTLSGHPGMPRCRRRRPRPRYFTNLKKRGSGAGFAADPIEAPPGLDDLLRRHIRALDQRPNTGVSPWLFPGRLPTQPIGPGGLGVRLKQVGIATRTVRTTALVELAAQLPAAVLADFIGIHPETAVTWSKIAGRDWNAYPALRQQSSRTSNNPDL
jgi:hypothetical protein